MKDIRYKISLHKSNKFVSAQIIDEEKGVTLVAVNGSETTKEKNKTNQAIAAAKVLGEKAKAKGIKKVYLDRSGYRYHGRVKAFADTLRESGLEF